MFNLGLPVYCHFRTIGHMARLWVGEPEILRSRNSLFTGPEVKGASGRRLRNPCSHPWKGSHLDDKSGGEMEAFLLFPFSVVWISWLQPFDKGGAWVVPGRNWTEGQCSLYLVSKPRTWNLSCPVFQPGVVGQMIEAAEERPWLWVVYILTVALPVFLVILFCCSGKVGVFLFSHF